MFTLERHVIVLHLSLFVVFAYLHFIRYFGEDVNYFGPQAYCPVGIQKYLNKSQTGAKLYLIYKPFCNYLFIHTYMYHTFTVSHKVHVSV